MTPERRALKLVRLLYQGDDTEDWQQFAKALSDELGGAAIALTTETDDWKKPQDAYWLGLSSGLADLLQRHIERGLPWRTSSDAVFLERFVATRTLVSNEELADTPFYREWMQPQGLACEGPLVHAVSSSDRRRSWTVLLYRVEGGRAFSEEDLTLCNLLVPHLSTFAKLFDRLDEVERERTAFSELVDRFLNGVFLVDVTGKLLLSNLEARRILETEDGIGLVEGLLCFEDSEAEGDLERFLEDAIGWRGRDLFGAGGELSIDRPSGKHPYVATVVPMNSAGPNSALGNEVAVVLVADLEADQSAAAQRVARTCDLTEAETELARLMAEGLSLETISRVRRVLISTTRTHLRHVFSKTGTRSQSELVRLLLSPASQPSEDRTAGS